MTIVLVASLPCLSQTNTTVTSECRDKCTGREGLENVLKFALTEPKQLNRENTIAQLNEMCG
jgi:hypothetical protein